LNVNGRCKRWMFAARHPLLCGFCGDAIGLTGTEIRWRDRPMRACHRLHERCKSRLGRANPGLGDRQRGDHDDRGHTTGREKRGGAESVGSVRGARGRARKMWILQSVQVMSAVGPCSSSCPKKRTSDQKTSISPMKRHICRCATIIRIRRPSQSATQRKSLGGMTPLDPSRHEHLPGVRFLKLAGGGALRYRFSFAEVSAGRRRGRLPGPPRNAKRHPQYRGREQHRSR